MRLGPEFGPAFFVLNDLDQTSWWKIFAAPCSVEGGSKPSVSARAPARTLFPCGSPGSSRVPSQRCYSKYLIDAQATVAVKYTAGFNKSFNSPAMAKIHQAPVERTSAIAPPVAGESIVSFRMVGSGAERIWCGSDSDGCWLWKQRGTSNYPTFPRSIFPLAWNTYG